MEEDYDEYDDEQDEAPTKMKLGFDESRTWVPPKLIGMLVSFVRGVKCLMIKILNVLKKRLRINKNGK